MSYRATTPKTNHQFTVKAHTSSNNPSSNRDDGLVRHDVLAGREEVHDRREDLGIQRLPVIMQCNGVSSTPSLFLSNQPRTSQSSSSDLVTEMNSLPKNTRVTPSIWNSFLASGERRTSSELGVKSCQRHA